MSAYIIIMKYFEKLGMSAFALNPHVLGSLKKIERKRMKNFLKHFTRKFQKIDGGPLASISDVPEFKPFLDKIRAVEKNFVTRVEAGADFPSEISKLKHEATVLYKTPEGQIHLDFGRSAGELLGHVEKGPRTATAFSLQPSGYDNFKKSMDVTPEITTAFKRIPTKSGKRKKL